MKKIFTILAAALMSAAVFADGESKVTKVGFHFPTADQPGDANIEMGGTFAEGKMAMEKIIASGWFVSHDFVNANEDDTFTIYDKTNPKKVLCKLIPSNGEGEGKWVQAVFKFGNYWKWDEEGYKGTPCMMFEMDIINDANFAWKENAPIADTLQLQLAINDSTMGEVAVTNLLGSGIVDLGEGKYTVPEDVEVSILAKPKEGYKFTGWKQGNIDEFKDCYYCGTAMNTEDNPLHIYMTKDMAIMATFAEKEEAIDNISQEAKAVKRIVNGQLLIEHDGKLFNAIGAEVK